MEESWKTEWGGQILFSHGTNHSRGTLVLLSPKIKLKVGQVDIDEEGRYVLFNAETQGVKLLLGNVYFPTRDKEKLQYEFIQKLEKSIVNIFIPNCPMILGGDFNTRIDEKLDYV